MAVKEFTVGAGHTFSPRPYESYRVEASLTMTVNPDIGEKYEDLMVEAQLKLRQALAKTYADQRRKEALGE